MSSSCTFYLQDDYHDGFAGPFSWETKVKLALLFTLKVTVLKKTYHLTLNHVSFCFLLIFISACSSVKIQLFIPQILNLLSRKSLKNRLQITLLILSEFKEIDNLSRLMNFYYSPLKKGFQMISRWIKINKFAEICLILESKFEYDP